MVTLLPLELPCWFTVCIPKHTTRLTSLQRITTLSEKSKNNPKILLHFEDDKAFFRFLDEDIICRLIATAECGKDLELRDTFIVQYGKEVVFCESDGNFFKTFFLNGRGRRIKYTHLPSNKRNNLENAVIIDQRSEANVSVNDRTISVKTGESQLDLQVELKKKYFTCQVHHEELRPKCESAILRSFVREETGLLEENQNEPFLSNTEDNCKKSAEPRTPFKGFSCTERSQFAIYTSFGKKIKHTRKSINSEELSNGDSVTRRKMMYKLNAEDETRASFLRSGEDAGPIRLLQKARNSTAFVNPQIRRVMREAIKCSARKKTGTFKKKTRKYSKKTRKKKARHFMKKRLCYSTKQMLSGNYEEQKELLEKQEKKSAIQKTSTSLKKMKKRRKKYAKKEVGRKMEKVTSNVEKRSDDEEIVKRRQKKPFRSKGWSWNTYENFKEKYMLDEDAFTQSLFKRNSTDKYSKEIIKMLRELTDLHEMTWKVNYTVYPAGRGNQQGNTDQYPTQVSDASTGNLNHPPAEQVHTSSGSIFQTYTCNTPAPTTNLMPSIDAERGLVSRIRGQLPESRFSQPQQPPRHPQYADQPTRQRSYSNWQTTNGQDPTRMAIYGFFYTGRFDLIRCFQCGIDLKKWSEANDPLFEHIKHSPDCQFLKDLLGQDQLNAYRNNQVHDNQFQFSSQSSLENRTQTAARIRNPQYSDLEARLRSFDSWPATSLQRPQSLADAGLFYTGYSDLCRCFTCDGGLQRWDADDDPWIEHARWFPHCAYVRQIKGQEYINMVQEAARQAREEEEDVVAPHPSPSRGQVHPPVSQCHRRCPVRQEMAEPSFQGEEQTMPDVQLFPGQRGQDRGNRQQREPVNVEFMRMDCPICRGLFLGDYTEITTISLEEENRQLRTSLICNVCEENICNILFIPCGHHRVCEHCAHNITTVCPYCGSRIDEKIKTFMS